MAYRDAEMDVREFLEWIVALKRTHMQIIGPGPVTTVVAGCTGYLLPGDWRPRIQAVDRLVRHVGGRC